MTICVFVGPTLSSSEVAGSIEAVCLPPVAQGDVWRAVRRYGPEAIGIVDGLFGGAPAVWHKEILWALSEGVAVFGSASMGALRAAELHGFGMRGVGRIFEAFRDGRLEDDGEVALIHGPAELGYPALSEPMVNIRATLARADNDGVIDPAARDLLEACATGMPFSERCWPDVLDRAGGVLDRAARAHLEAWLGTGRVDQKRADALEMLAAMREGGRAEVPAPAFRFAETHHWHRLVARGRADEGPAAQDVLDELRLEPRPGARALRLRALLRSASLEPAEPTLVDASADDAVEALRAALGLHTRAAVQAWLCSNDMTHGTFRDLAERSRRVEAFTRQAGTRLSICLLDEARLSGDYPRLVARARAKAAALAGAGAQSGRSLAPGERMALRQWFAARRLDAAGDVGLAELLDATGFEDADALDRALHREHLYLTLASPAPED